ncbi:MAG: DNA/RNA nuclease SfsA [Humidesulfovibrio sp.]|nr:DNA/RNA nuclease SfsA [Humidesulfovibrio sp.]
MSDASGRILLLPFPPGCRVTQLVRREKRFTAVTVDPATGAELRAHTNNTGSMLGLLRSGTPALLSPAPPPRKNGPDRVLKWTLEALALPGAPLNDSALVLPEPAAALKGPMTEPQGPWVGVNTLTPNRLLEAAFRAGLLPEAHGYAHLAREAKTGASRLDALITPEEGSGLPPLYVECKNVTLVLGDQAQFPDAATERGRKHLAELTRLVHEGCRAALFFLVQRPDGGFFAPAEAIDPDYARALAVALGAGVEAWVWRASITGPGTGAGISLAERLPLAPAWAALQRPKEHPLK